MNPRLGDVPLDVRTEIVAAIRNRGGWLATALMGPISQELALARADGAACADALVSLLAAVLEAAGAHSGRSLAGRSTGFPPAITRRQLVNAAHAAERAVLEDLARHHRLGAGSEYWPMVAYSVRHAVLEMVAGLAEREAARAAVRDPLTTLLSAELFTLALAQEVRRAHRHKHGIAVILFDIDDLSQLNRDHGYGVGNRLLERLGILARRFFRTHDWVARHAGDSIAVMLPETTLDHAATLANRFREMVQQRLVLVDHKTDETSAVTLSAAAVGVDLVQAEVEPAYVMAEAEAAVMRAKLNGRNRVERVALLPTSVTIPGAATLLGMTTREVVHLIRRGSLPAARRGRHYHIDRSAIDAYKPHRGGQQGVRS